MTEEQKDPIPVEESPTQEEPIPVEVEESAFVEQPAGGQKAGWIAAVGAIAVILILCAVVVCIAATVAAASGAAPPAATSTPVPTRDLSAGAMIVITEPDQGQVVNIDRPIKVQGQGIGLPEGNVVVEVLDAQGKVLAQKPTTLQGPDVGTGGAGTWSVELTVQVEPGTAGKVRAYASSPKDGSVIAEAVVEVSLGSTAPAATFLEIESPTEGAEVDITGPVLVRGQGGGLPEGNVVVQALDSRGKVLAQQPTTLQGPDVGIGGAGTWSVELTVDAVPGSAGRIVAFSPSPAGGRNIASAVVNVTYSGPLVLEGPTWVWSQSLPDVEITALFEDGQVSGSAGCNRYFGSYTTGQEGGLDTIRFSPLATTRRACEEPTMALETEFLAGLQSATSYVIEGHALTITYPGGTLVFYNKEGARPR